MLTIIFTQKYFLEHYAHKSFLQVKVQTFFSDSHFGHLFLSKIEKKNSNLENKSRGVQNFFKYLLIYIIQTLSLLS